MKILLIEDDETLRRAVSLKLSREVCEVATAETIAEAEKKFYEISPLLVICDICLPDGNGLELCRRIRKNSSVLFLFLTALDTEADIINGYDAGADDYITKPFSLSVLVSKVNAMLKRRVSEDHQKIIRSENITLNADENRAYKDGEPLNLTATEYRLLEYFMLAPQRVHSKNSILSAVWDSDGNFVDDNTLAVNIRRLREKIETDASKPELIRNIRGLGYIWEKGCERI